MKLLDKYLAAGFTFYYYFIKCIQKLFEAAFSFYFKYVYIPLLFVIYL